MDDKTTVSVDWLALKQEYITTETSFRRLAKKYGVSLSTLTKRAISGEWFKAKQQMESKAVARTIEQASVAKADRTARMIDVASKAMDLIELKLNEAIALEGRMSPTNIKMLTGALRDIKDIQKHDLDVDEQRARISQLKAQVEKMTKDEDSTNMVQVMILNADEYKD